MDVHDDERKFTELVLYVADRLRSDRSGGATKLNKVLFFADFAHVRRHGSPITGAAYQKLGWGPAPRRLVPVRERLIASGDAHVEITEFLGRQVQRVVPDRPADLSVFSAEEIATIDQVLTDLEGMTATQVSDLSHEEPGWRLVDDGRRSRTRQRSSAPFRSPRPPPADCRRWPLRGSASCRRDPPRHGPLRRHRSRS